MGDVFAFVLVQEIVMGIPKVVPKQVISAAKLASAVLHARPQPCWGDCCCGLHRIVECRILLIRYQPQINGFHHDTNTGIKLTSVADRVEKKNLTPRWGITAFGPAVRRFCR